jgi:hypothetical protein
MPSECSCGATLQRLIDVKQEKLMEAKVISHFRMEAEAEVMTLHHGHRLSVKSGNYLSSGTDGFDARSPDEHGAERGNPERLDIDISLERVHLAAEGVATGSDVEHPERQLVGPAVEHGAAEQDEPGAGRHGRHAFV